MDLLGYEECNVSFKSERIQPSEEKIERGRCEREKVRKGENEKVRKGENEKGRKEKMRKQNKDLQFE